MAFPGSGTKAPECRRYHGSPLSALIIDATAAASQRSVKAAVCIQGDGVHIHGSGAPEQLYWDVAYRGIEEPTGKGREDWRAAGRTAGRWRWKDNAGKSYRRKSVVLYISEPKTFLCTWGISWSSFMNLVAVVPSFVL